MLKSENPAAANLAEHSVMPCLMETWHLTETEIYYWLIKQTQDTDLSSDLLQDTFLKALQQKHSFCDIYNQRAWLYRVARNLLIDKQRKANRLVEFDLDSISYSISSSNLSSHEPMWRHEEQPPIDSLTQCLPKALEQLSLSDKSIIKQCDLQGISQQEFASQNGLTLVATKSRIQRARQKLKAVLQSQCQIRFDDQQRVCCFYREEN